MEGILVPLFVPLLEKFSEFATFNSNSKSEITQMC